MNVLLKAFALAGMLMLTLQGADDSTAVLVSPPVLHGLAASVTLPVYPRVSQKSNHTGVAVVEVTVSPSGKVVKANILQAPDQAISESVSAAVKEWTFHPFVAHGTSMAMSSRLIFYFRLVHGKPTVIDALSPTPLVHALTR